MKKEGFLRKEQMSSEQRELAMLLKNKRIEQGRKLEDSASGICSTSYLSRIENNQVKLQDPYLRMLFEKLDINYDDLKKERQTNIFIELVKYQLLEQYDKYASKIAKPNGAIIFIKPCNHENKNPTLSIVLYIVIITTAKINQAIYFLYFLSLIYL